MRRLCTKVHRGEHIGFHQPVLLEIGCFDDGVSYVCVPDVQSASNATGTLERVAHIISDGIMQTVQSSPLQALIYGLAALRDPVIVQYFCITCSLLMLGPHATLLAFRVTPIVYANDVS